VASGEGTACVPASGGTGVCDSGTCRPCGKDGDPFVNGVGCCPGFYGDHAICNACRVQGAACREFYECCAGFTCFGPTNAKTCRDCGGGPCCGKDGDPFVAGVGCCPGYYGDNAICNACHPAASACTESFQCCSGLTCFGPNNSETCRDCGGGPCCGRAGDPFVNGVGCCPGFYGDNAICNACHPAASACTESFQCCNGLTCTGPAGGKTCQGS
jgi:hypothetical protein